MLSRNFSVIDPNWIYTDRADRIYCTHKEFRPSLARVGMKMKALTLARIGQGVRRRATHHRAAPYLGPPRTYPHARGECFRAHKRQGESDNPSPPSLPAGKG